MGYTTYVAVVHFASKKRGSTLAPNHSTVESFLRLPNKTFAGGNSSKGVHSPSAGMPNGYPLDDLAVPPQTLARIKATPGASSGPCRPLIPVHVVH